MFNCEILLRITADLLVVKQSIEKVNNNAIANFLLSVSLFLLELFYDVKWHPFRNRTLSGKHELLARDFVLQKNFNGSMLELQWKTVEREANVIEFTTDKGPMKTKDVHSRNFFPFI